MLATLAGGQPIDWQHRPTNFWWWLDPDAPRPLVAHHPDHDPWRHLSLFAVTWHHHGVFRPPPGAVTLISSAAGGAVLYIDQASTPGTLVVAALDPMSHYGSYFMPATERFLDGFLPWLAHVDVTATHVTANVKERP